MIDTGDLGAVVEVLGEATAILRRTTDERSVIRLPRRGRLLATGDLHDNPFHFAAVHRLARLDRDPDHHVVLHELIHGNRLVNGMDFSYRMLVRAAELVIAHPGQVHPMLANHELAQMTGRGVSKGSGNSVEQFDEALEFAFGTDAPDAVASLHAFIRAMPLAVASEDGVACAHSLPAHLKGFDLDVFDRPLAEEDYAAPKGAAYRMTWGRAYGDDVIERIADRLGVRLLCLGHEYVETGVEMRGPRVLILNSDHERATVVPLDLSDVPTAEEAFFAAVPLATVMAD